LEGYFRIVMMISYVKVTQSNLYLFI